MKNVEFIDIVEKERIQEMLDDIENFVFEALGCETLDGWVLDIGFKNYPNKSIYVLPLL